jgi:hypothetical protein
MVRHILKKDWRLLWPLVALVTAIQAGLEWAVFRSGFFGDDAGAGELLRPLGIAWFAGIAALVIAVAHEDPIPGVEQDWLIRPLSRTDLVLAKALFLLLTISVPMLVINVAHALVMGFPLGLACGALLCKALWLFVCLIVPLLALAATTRNMTELAIMGSALVVVYAVSLGLGTIALGIDRCPTCDTGLAWLQHTAAHAGIFAGALLILFLQFYRRRTELSRQLALLGAVALVFVQFPWNAAFGLQKWLDRARDPQSAVSLEVVAERGTSLIAGRDRPTGSREATRALLHGDMDEAARYLRTRVREERASVVIDVPVRITGISGDQLLLIDRSELRVLASAGRVLYRRTHAAEPLATLMPATRAATTDSDLTTLKWGLPESVYQAAQARAATLQMAYSLTLLGVDARHQLAALNGTMRTPETGLCITKADADQVRLRCKQLARTPFCYSATLHGPDGRHNPEVFNCSPDYRPYVPSLTDTLSFLGVDLPTRDRSGLAHYPVDSESVAQSYVVLKVYGVRRHFKQVLLAGLPGQG